MKKNDKRIDRVYSFFNAIRGNNTPNEYQSVLAVLKKVMVLQDCAQNEMDYDELYQLMESIATDFEIPNPFPEKERFVDIYRTLQGFDELSWTDILEYGDDRSKLRVPESVVDEMEKIRLEYVETKDKALWYDLIQLLPSSYNQMRTCTLNYETLINIYKSRKHHKLEEWRSFCEWIETLPYAKELIIAEE